MLKESWVFGTDNRTITPKNEFVNQKIRDTDKNFVHNHINTAT